MFWRSSCAAGLELWRGGPLKDAVKREPQLSADQEAHPLTDITETTDANGVIWGKGMHNGVLRDWRLQIPPTNREPVPLYAYLHGAAGWMTKYDEFDGILATSNERILLIGRGGIPDFDWDRNMRGLLLECRERSVGIRGTSTLREH